MQELHFFHVFIIIKKESDRKYKNRTNVQSQTNIKKLLEKKNGKHDKQKG